MPGPISNKRVFRKRKKPVSEGLKELGGAIGVLAEKRRLKRERERQQRLEEEDLRLKAEEREFERGRQTRADARADRQEGRLAASAEDLAKSRAHSRDIATRGADLAREKFEFDKTRPRGAGASRKPFEFEARSARIKKLLTEDIDESPFRFGFEAIAKELSNSGDVNIKSADFQKKLVDKIAEKFEKDEPVDHLIIADYMLKNATVLPWVIDSTDPEVEVQRKSILARIGDFFGDVKEKAGEFLFGTETPAQTPDDLIDQRLSQ